MLAPLPMTILEQVAGDLAPVSYADGDPIIREGEVGDRFYILASGQTSVTSGGEQRAAMGPGDSFGEIALVRNVPRTASVTAVGPVEGFALDRDAFCAAVTGDVRSRAAAEAVVRKRLAQTRFPPGG
jgi:CRP-like cAMP-binding protein